MSRKLKCRHCGEYEESEKGVRVPLGFFCSMANVADHGLSKSKAATERRIAKANNAIKDKQKADRRKIREDKERLRPRSWYLKEAQKWFNKFIRMRDAGQPCISCEKPDNGQHQRHASHYRSVGACSSMRYDENNVHSSCSVCNAWLSGNIGEYTPRLIVKIGQSEYERIKYAPNIYAWSIDELKEITKEYKKKCKSLS